MKKGQRRYRDWKSDGFPGWLQEKMRERGWNARRLAMEVGVQPSLISRWMSGSQLPSMESCQAIAAALLLGEQDVLRAAGYLSDDLDVTDPRVTEIRAKIDALLEMEQFSQDLYETIIVLLNNRLSKIRASEEQQWQEDTRVPDARCAVVILDDWGKRSQDGGEKTLHHLTR